MGLRLAEGVDLDRLSREGGAAPSAAAVAEMSALGFIDVFDGARGEKRVRATHKGRFVLNEIVLRLALSFEARPPRAPAVDFHLPTD